TYDLEVCAGVALRLVGAAEEYHVYARAHRPEHARECSAVAAVVAAPAQDLHGLAREVVREVRGDGACRGIGRGLHQKERGDGVTLRRPRVNLAQLRRRQDLSHARDDSTKDFEVLSLDLKLLTVSC